MLEEQTSEGIDSRPSRKILTTYHKPRETVIPEDSEDTFLSSKEPKTNFVDHQAQIEEEEGDLSTSKEGKTVDKTSITSAFNDLNPLGWPH